MDAIEAIDAIDFYYMLRAFQRADDDLSELDGSSVIVKKLTDSLSTFLAGAGIVANFLFNTYTLFCFAICIIISRIYVFASTRIPVKMNFWYRLALRGSAIISLVLLVRPLLESIEQQRGMLMLSFLEPDLPIAFTPADEWPLSWDIYFAFSLSYLIEVFTSVIEHSSPNYDFGFTYVEFFTIFRAAQVSERPMALDIQLLFLVSLGAQIVTHIQGLFPAIRHRLLISTITSIAMSSLYVYMLVQGYMTSLMLISLMSVRTIPKIIATSMVLLCWSIYFIAALVAGESNLNMYTSHKGLNVSSDDMYFQAIMKLFLQAIDMTGDKKYMKDSGYLVLQKMTWVEKLGVNPVSSPKVFKNPYGRPRSRPPPQIEDDIFTERDPLQNFPALIKRVGIVSAMSFYMVKGLFRKVLDQDLSSLNSAGAPTDPDEDTRLQLYLDPLVNRILDKFPEAYASLLLGKRFVEVDSSADFVVSPQDDTTDQSATESDYYEEDADFDDDMQDDKLLCAENIIEMMHEDGGDQIVSKHLNSETTVTRLSYLTSVGKSDRLISVIKERRSPNSSAEEKTNDCVICLTNPRNVVVWPCRCFALCDDCRSALYIKGYSQCVCCRQRVESFSKVFIP